MIKFFTIAPVVLYLIFVVAKYGLQKSISDSFYKLTEKEKPLFFFALFSTGLFIFFVWAYFHPYDLRSNIILLIAAAGIGYTATAAYFKHSSVINTWHVAGAISGYVLGYVFIVSVYRWESLYFIIPSLAIMGLIHLNEKKKEKRQHYLNQSAELNQIRIYINKSVWWDEIIGLITIYLATL